MIRVRRTAIAVLLSAACGLGSMATASAITLPDNNAGRAQCQFYANNIADLNAQADRAKDRLRANRLRLQAENIAKTAASVGC